MKQKITVFGSFVVDLMARTPHLPAPGETVKGSFFKQGAGGKGFNQGIAAHKTGADVAMITKLGRDSLAGVATDAMDAVGMPKDYLFFNDTAPTGVALIMVAGAMTLSRGGTLAVLFTFATAAILFSFRRRTGMYLLPVWGGLFIAFCLLFWLGVNEPIQQRMGTLLETQEQESALKTNPRLDNWKSAFETEWEERVEALTKEERKMLLAIVKKSLKAK